PLSPAQIAHVDQPVDSVFDLDKRAEISQVADTPFHCGADGIFLMQTLPGVGFKLLQAQRDAPLARIDVEHHAFDFIAHVDDLRRVLHALGPRHLAYVHQAFNALLQFDKGAVVGNAQHAAFHARANRIALRGIEPGIGRELLEPERDAQFFAIELQHLHLDLVAHVDQVARMRQSAPRHVSDVEQIVNAAQIDKGAVVGEVFDCAGQDRALMEAFQRLAALAGDLFIQDGLAGNNDIAAFLVELDNADLNLVALERLQVAHRVNVYLRPRHNRFHADIHGDPTLDPLHHRALDALFRVIRLLNVLPDPDALRPFMREQNGAFFVLAALDHDFNFLARLELDVAGSIGHFRDRYQAFRLEADIDNNMGWGDLDDGAFEDIVFTWRRLSFKGVRFKSRGKVFHVGFFFVSHARAGVLNRLSLRFIPGHSG